MKMLSHRLGRMFLAAAIVVAVCSATAANAAYVTAMTGAYGTAAGVDANHFVFTPSALELTADPLPPPVDFSDVIVDLSGYTGSPGDVSLSPNFTVTSPGGSAVFAFLNPALLEKSDTAVPPGGTITGVLKLLSNTIPGATFAAAYDFTFAYSGIDVHDDGTYTFSRLSSAGFSAVAVPEPTSLAVMSVLGLTGFFARRKYAKPVNA